MNKEEYRKKLLKEYQSGDIERIDLAKDRDVYIVVYVAESENTRQKLKSYVNKEDIKELLTISKKSGTGFVYNGEIKPTKKIL